MSQNFVPTNHEVTDGAGFIWDISRYGAITDGSNNTFDTGMSFSNLTYQYYMQVDGSGRNFTVHPNLNSYGILAEREIYVSPTDGYARFFDTVTNASSDTVTYTYRLTSDFGANGSTVAETSSGDGAVTNADTWVIGYHSTGDTGAAGILFGNQSGSSNVEQELSYDDLTYEYTLSLAPGESVSFLSFASQGTSVSDISQTMEDLQDLPNGALSGLSAAQINSIVNWDIPDMNLGIEGTAQDDLLAGASGDDTLRGLDGDDLLQAGQGDDELVGGLGSDTLFGGGGDDELTGGNSNAQVTTNAATTLANGEELAISLTMQDAGSGNSTQISGFISREEVISHEVDLVFAIDISGSTSDTFSGSIDIGDRNGDGQSNTILDAEIASFEALHESIVSDANLPDADITIVSFESHSVTSPTFNATEDLDDNGVADVLDYVRSLQYNYYGGTNFERALQAAQAHFQSNGGGQNYLYYLSDGGNNEGGSLTDEVSALAGLGVQTQSFGVGSGANEADLDIVDDNTDNGSTTIVLDPSSLADELLDPGIEAADLRSVQVYLNGQVAATIDPDDLVITPFGLRYFELELTGLRTSADDVIEVRVTADDGSSTTLSTSQTYEHVAGSDAGDLLFGGNGADTLFGGDGNDTLVGGGDADELIGGAGKDTASYIDAETGVSISLSGSAPFLGDAQGDTLFSIENLTGSNFADELSGNRGRNTLIGRHGDDLLEGLSGKDVLNGGRGDDTLTGGGGADRFVFRENGGQDLITDFTKNKRGEKIDLRDFEIESFRELKSMMSTRNGDTTIDFGNGDLLVIEDMSMNEFRSNDFLL